MKINYSEFSPEKLLAEYKAARNAVVIYGRTPAGMDRIADIEAEILTRLHERDAARKAEEDGR